MAVELGDDAALFAVLDGLGHGTEAAAAASRAVEVLRGSPPSRSKPWSSFATTPWRTPEASP
ncbi:hypothetical protein I553_4394 [Mycobacterium xenopi 4042]|uniref:Stage II sporulation E family protein n=1 Tax=Mycobacterium xenopi 4042 TaxID=1299334 RepID=X8AGJ2_MYCXE|nr:hypothetical protein I553_4394 [Mycobacterium xenopi 4042]